VYGSAPAVAAFELEVFEFMERFVKEEGVECDWYVFLLVLFPLFELAVGRDIWGCCAGPKVLMLTAG
jgi:hypothetical protein